MEKIKCFVACSLSLEDERNALRAILQKQQNKFDIFVECKTSDDFPHHLDPGTQAGYNNYIANECDIVVFIIEKLLGSKTEEELDVALSTFQRNGHRPKIFLFCNEEGMPPEEIARVIAKINGGYYIAYNNGELNSKAEQKLTDYFITTYREKDGSWEGIKKHGSKFKAWMGVLLLIVIALIVINNRYSTEPGDKPLTEKEAAISYLNGFKEGEEVVLKADVISEMDNPYLNRIFVALINYDQKELSMINDSLNGFKGAPAFKAFMIEALKNFPQQLPETYYAEIEESIEGDIIVQNFSNDIHGNRYIEALKEKCAEYEKD